MAGLYFGFSAFMMRALASRAGLVLFVVALIERSRLGRATR
jgi:hypothetical protein